MVQTHLKAVVSGSFHRHLDDVQGAVRDLVERGVEVLSPADPIVVDRFGDFLFVASDQLRSIRGVQSRHLTAIQGADFVWLVDPDGYVGASAAMELGFAAAVATPVFTLTAPNDLTLRQYVHTVPSVRGALERLTTKEARQHDTSMLIDPVKATQLLHDEADILQRYLTGQARSADDDHLLESFDRLRALIQLP